MYFLRFLAYDFIAEGYKHNKSIANYNQLS